jgi:hypothetical protein
MIKERIHVLCRPYEDRCGRVFSVEVQGEIVREECWAGSIIFWARDGGGCRIASHETEQPSREYLQYWATGISTVYLDGAFERATPLAR